MHSRKNLFSFLNNSNSFYYLTIDCNYRYTYANNLFKTIFGYSAEDFIGKCFLTLIHPEDQSTYLDAVSPCLTRPGTHVSLDLRTPRVDGSLFWIRWEFTTLFDDRQQPIGLQCIGNDITERKRAQIEMQEAQENLQLLLNNTDELFVMIDHELKILSYNHAANQNIRNWFGFELKKRRSLLSYIGPEWHAQLQKFCSEALQRKENETGVRLSSRQGDAIYSIRFRPVLNDVGEIVGTIITGRDVTEKRIAEEKLVYNERHFRALIENSAEAITILSPKGVALDLTASASKILGYSREEIINQPMLFFIHQSDKKSVITSFREILSVPDKITTLQFRIRNKIGEYKWSLGSFHNLLHEPSIQGIVVNFSDITEKVKAEEKLSQERQLLRTLIDHLPDYIYVKDTYFRHVINNKANVNLIGAHSEAETLGKTVIDYFGAEAWQYIEKDKIVLQSGEPINNLEEYLITDKGEKRWLLTTKVPLKDEKNNVIGLVGISRDITRQKITEESLRRINERYHMVSKATNDAIWDWDLITNKVLWNDGIKYLFGYSEIEDTADWWANTIHPDDRKRVIKKIYKHIDEGIENWQDEYRFTCSDGSYKFVFDRGFILFDEKNTPYRMIGAMVDTSELKKLEDELANQKITRQIQITEATIQAQEQERSEIGRELHDNINQILTTTKLYLDMAMDEPDIREQLIQKSHSNISKAIEEIRILSKSLVPPSLGDIGISEALSEMISNLNIAKKIKINLKTTIPDHTTISGNIKLMGYRIVQEQLNNIIKHSKATEVDIQLSVSRKMFNITISDNGVGFDLKQKAKGIGLSNITSRAELYNGKVEIVTAPREGCMLKVRIPI